MLSEPRSITAFAWNHPANEGQRARALMRAVRFQVRGRVPRRPTVVRLGDWSSVLAYLHPTFRLIQLGWKSASRAAVGADRREGASLPEACGYGLYRPDAPGMLAPVRDAGFGDDVFARAGG
jgi:hypothetical protein